MLYRVFPRRPGTDALELGSPLFVARDLQGGGRHDNPDSYGALYLSHRPEAAVSEHLRGQVGEVVTDAFLAEGRLPLFLAAIDDSRLPAIPDLDLPRELLRRDLRPSLVATRTRKITQHLAHEIFLERVPGFRWWSAIEASWPNVTLFVERAARHLRIAGEPEPLTIRHPAVQASAEVLGIGLAR